MSQRIAPDQSEPLLELLRDIHLPPSPPWWETPISVYAVTALVVLFVALWVWVERERARPRRGALRALAELRSHLGTNQGDVAADVSTLLRRLAIQRHGRIPVAGLTGERWRSFLDGSGGAGGFAKISDALLKAPYQETDDSTVADLLAVTERWIRAGTRGEGAVGSISAIKVLVKKLRADAKSALAGTLGKGRDPGGLVEPAMDCLERACAESDPNAARQALLAWGATVWPEHPPVGLRALGTRLGKPETIAEIRRLEQSLYGGDPNAASTWTGTALLSSIRALNLSASARDDVEQSALPPLHPASGAVCDA